MAFLGSALLLSNWFCLADTPPADDPAQFSYPEETLAHQFQPPVGDILQRYRFTPPNARPGNQYPTVLMLPPDIFKLEYADAGNASERVATHDLQNAGFLVFQVDHRLAPPGKLNGQGADPGYAPEQTDDLKRQILAALADVQCNGSIYLVGGSAGGCLALWCALDPASTVSGWDETARSHIKAVVSLSGPTDFCDWSNPGGIPPGKLTDFENNLDNYVDLPSQTDCAHDTNGNLEHASPEWLVTNGATSSPPPVMLYAADGDPVPNAQATDMYNTLRARYGFSYGVDKYNNALPVHGSNQPFV